MHPFKPLLHRSAAKLLLACAIALPVGGALPARPPDLQLSYLVNFHNGSLDPSVDKQKFGAMKEGDSDVAGSEPRWDKKPGSLELGIKQPAGTNGPVSAGVWTTPVNFGSGSKFAIEATFVSPNGPHDMGNVWAVAVTARTGNEHDLAAAVRAGATLQVRADKARLNGPGLDPPLGLDNLTQPNYDRLFKSNAGGPFTLTLAIDRTTGKATASLKIGDLVVTKDSKLGDLKPSDTITSVGAAIVIANGSGKSASVQIREFRILTPKSNG